MQRWFCRMRALDAAEKLLHLLRAMLWIRWIWTVCGVFRKMIRYFDGQRQKGKCLCRQ